MNDIETTLCYDLESAGEATERPAPRASNSTQRLLEKFRSTAWAGGDVFNWTDQNFKKVHVFSEQNLAHYVARGENEWANVETYDLEDLCKRCREPPNHKSKAMAVGFAMDCWERKARGAGRYIR